MRRFLALLILLLPAVARSADLKVATWNLDWLTTREAGDRFLPPDVTPRSAEDFDRLARYAQDLNADVVAIEEVDGWGAASRLFPRDQYSIHMTRDRVTQRVGIAVRRTLRYDVNPDVTGLGLGHLRSGADVTLHLGTANLRVLAVHLKKGCRSRRVLHSGGLACQELLDQAQLLAEWITARRQDGVPFLILGDFNRSMDGKDMVLALLRQAAPLARATEGHSSPCWGNQSFVDHILAGGAAADWMRPDTLRVLTYRETDRAWKDRLSDHCPVSVRLTVPE
jgi:endonuclease/exonuclease/phosphatase family metal-dependent hydrolase